MQLRDVGVAVGLHVQRNRDARLHADGLATPCGAARLAAQPQNHGAGLAYVIGRACHAAMLAEGWLTRWLKAVSSVALFDHVSQGAGCRVRGGVQVAVEELFQSVEVSQGRAPFALLG